MQKLLQNQSRVSLVTKRASRVCVVAALAASSMLAQSFRTGTAKQAPAESSTPPGPTPRTADGRPDFTGYWKNQPGTITGNIGKDLPGLKLPFTPAGEAALKYNLTKQIDPESLCILGGIPRHNASGMAFEVLQGSGKVAFLYNYTYFRLIPLSGHHTEDPDPGFFGEEIGNWDGDTLVVDSITFKGEKVWIDENANPHSDELHVVERWTRPDAEHIHVETLIDDPKYYTHSFTYSRTWVAGKPGETVHEFACSENNIDAAHLGPGPGPIRTDGTRGYDNVAPLPPPPTPVKQAPSPKK